MFLNSLSLLQGKLYNHNDGQLESSVTEGKVLRQGKSMLKL